MESIFLRKNISIQSAFHIRGFSQLQFKNIWEKKLHLVAEVYYI